MQRKINENLKQTNKHKNRRLQFSYTWLWCNKSNKKYTKIKIRVYIISQEVKQPSESIQSVINAEECSGALERSDSQRHISSCDL